MIKTQTIKFDKAFIKRMMKIIVPIVLSQMLMVVVGFVDNFMIAKYDVAQNHLAAVGIGAEIWFGMSAIYSSVGAVFAVLYAQFHASENQSKFKSIFKINVHVGLVFALGVSLILYFLAPQLVGLFFLNQEGSIAPKSIAIDYVKILALGNIFISIAYMLVNPLVIMGKTKYLLIIAITSILTNTMLDYIFIYTLDMGAQGAAISTVVSYFISLLLAIYFFIKNIDYFKGLGNIFKWDKKMFIFFLKRSWMIITITMMVWSFVSITIVLTSMYGSSLMKSLSIGYAIISVIFTMLASISSVIKIVVSKELGNSNFGAAKVLAKYLFRVVMMNIIGLALLGTLAAFTLPQLLINNAQDQNNARDLILIMSWAMVGFGIQTYFVGILEAGGSQMYPAILNYYTTFWLVVPILIICGPWVAGLDFAPSYAIAHFSIILPAIAGYIIYRKDKWLVNLNEHKDLT